MAVKEAVREAKAEKESRASYKNHRYDIQFTFGPDGVAGSIPVGNSIRKDYAVLMQAGASNFIKLAIANGQEITQKHIDAYMERTLAVFHVDVTGAFIPENQIISTILNAATRTKLTIMRKGVRGTLVTGTTFMRPKRLYMDGDVFEQQSFVTIRTGGCTPKSFQILVNVKPIKLELWSLDNGDITPDDMRNLWEVAQEIGIGGCRRLGYGKFTLDKFETIS